MTFNFEAVRDVLVCPKSRARLVHENGSLVSTDPHTRLQYRIVDDIPCLLVEQASELSMEDWSGVMRRHGCDPKTGRPINGNPV